MYCHCLPLKEVPPDLTWMVDNFCDEGMFLIFLFIIAFLGCSARIKAQSSTSDRRFNVVLFHSLPNPSPLSHPAHTTGKFFTKTTVVLLNTRSFYDQCNYFATLGFSNYNRNTIFSCFISFNTCYCLKLKLLHIHFTTIGKLNTIILQCSILDLKTQLLCMEHS